MQQDGKYGGNGRRNLRTGRKGSGSTGGTVRRRRFRLPWPKCVVFYNGEKEEPEERVLKLSDAFAGREQEADVKLRVRMIIINYGHNGTLMERCRTLEEGIETGKQQGSQMTLIKNVDLLMKNFNVALPDACAALETSVEEYEAAKGQAALWKEFQNE